MVLDLQLGCVRASSSRETCSVTVTWTIASLVWLLVLCLHHKAQGPLDVASVFIKAVPVEHVFGQLDLDELWGGT